MPQLLASIFFFLFSLIIQATFAQSKYTVSGYVKDALNGEALIGVTVYVKEVNNGVTTNAYGFYSVTLPPGNYTVEYSYIGFTKKTEIISLSKDTRLDIELSEQSSELSEVVISADELEADKVQTVEMSTAKLDMKAISKIAALLGEIDIVKSLQMIPGVSSVGEGASGFNVRGGSVGQNLLLLDEAPVFNSSHMLGFFSAFNPDAVKDVKLYKGGIPARYGGRLSSLLDVRMKEGNNKKISASGGIGTVFSRLALEGPIVKDKGSFIIAGRRSYIDLLAAPVLNDVKLNFYDLTAKANYAVNDKNRFYLSGYFGRDRFGFGAGQGLDWGNQTLTFRWNKLINEKLFANLTAVYSNYDYQLELGDKTDEFRWKSNISNIIIKPEFSYFLSNSNELTFGAELTKYDFQPATTFGVSAGEAFENTLQKKNAMETALHFSDNIEFSDKVSMEAGLRLSNFNYIGEGTAYTFNDTVPGKRRTPIAETSYDRGDRIATYTNLEPRLAFRVKLDEFNAMKVSYNRTAQYVHLISNTIASNPLDIWTPSTNVIKPQIGDQIALGYFRNSFNRQWELSVEAYYRKLDNQVDYINGADLLINKYLEGDLLMGEGRAYGLEFYLQRKVGKLTGWASYTLSKTELKIEGINRNDWYPAVYDQPHNFKLTGSYEINPRWSVSSNFVYVTGTPTSAPTSKYYSQGIAVPYNVNESRNNYRLTDYNRLDLAFRMEGKKFNKRGKERVNHDHWVFSLYNVYARKNAFVVDFNQVDRRFSAGSPIQTQAVRTSLLGTIVPSVSYNFKF